MNFVTEHKTVHLSTEPMRDRLNGNWASDVIHMAEYRDILFIVDQSSGIGEGEISVQSLDDILPTTTSARSGGRFRSSTSPDTWDAWGAISTSSGFLTGITTDKTYEIWVSANELSGTDEYIRLNVDETVNAPIEINMIAILFNPRHASDVDPVTSLT